MDRQLAIKTLNNPKSSKAELKNALSFALGVAYEPDTPEKQQTLFNTCQTVFCDLYKTETGLTYVFTGQDGKSLSQLLDKVKGLLEFVTDENVIITFKALITKLPDWYKQKAFSLPVINKKFNEIVSSIKLDGKGKSKVSDSYREQLRKDLRS